MVNALLKEIQWEADDRTSQKMGAQESTPEKKYKEILARTHLSPSVLKETPPKVKDF